MNEKPKRKNDEPIPRRYWWIFGILAILLLGTLPFPIRILYWWVLNPLLYWLITLACLWAVVRFIRRYSWKRRIVPVMLVTLLLAWWHFIPLSFVEFMEMNYSDRTCSVEYSGIMTTHHCARVFCRGAFFAPTTVISFDYVTLGHLPIAFQTTENVFKVCLF
jgi:hypothetical protein